MARTMILHQHDLRYSAGISWMISYSREDDMGGAWHTLLAIELPWPLMEVIFYGCNNTEEEDADV